MRGAVPITSNFVGKCGRDRLRRTAEIGSEGRTGEASKCRALRLRQAGLLARYPSTSAMIYVASVIALALTALFAVLDIDERHRAVNASADVLARLERRAASLSSESNWTSDSIPAGSPFLEGQTVTVASAALLQQITAAITGAGGRIVSSEVKPQGERSGDAFIRVVANCELEEGALPNLLYGIEAGMPFLFIDQFVAEAPANEGGRMHVVLGVSGLWLGTK